MDLKNLSFLDIPHIILDHKIITLAIIYPLFVFTFLCLEENYKETSNIVNGI